MLRRPGGHVEIVQSRIQQGELISVAAGTLASRWRTHRRRIADDGHGVGADLSRRSGIEKMLQEGVAAGNARPRRARRQGRRISTICSARSTRQFPAWQDGEAERQCRRCAGINSLGSEAMLEGKKARAFPLRFCDGAVISGAVQGRPDPAAVQLFRAQIKSLIARP